MLSTESLLIIPWTCKFLILGGCFPCFVSYGACSVFFAVWLCPFRLDSIPWSLSWLFFVKMAFFLVSIAQLLFTYVRSCYFVSKIYVLFSFIYNCCMPYLTYKIRMLITSTSNMKMKKVIQNKNLVNISEFLLLAIHRKGTMLCTFCLIFILCWGVVGLQCCVNFRCTAKWFSYTCTYFCSFADTLLCRLL